MENTGMKILVHASAFFAPFLVPVIVFILSSDQEVKKLSIQALLFQLVMSALIFASSLLTVILIGFPLLLLFGAIAIIVPIIAIVKALNNEPYNYPVVGSWYQ
ncbi:DUF4870 domain-containing protein [Planococcus rifietoensis]|uniref:DUF4870 domain-containing protein n=1 Tax=Planococcus rifietoensis TaxID=200991 RepID=A0A0U2YKT8_9BACL|nr:DUF4870 domain-containing protein [Planococcus rifietoensis]ALS75242.1 hypothetical protein AUC31_08410 [Planococcus rifietoensis]